MNYVVWMIDRFVSSSMCCHIVPQCGMLLMLEHVSAYPLPF